MMEKKVLVLGVDGMDPRFTKRLLKEGKLPNIQKYIEMGSARDDLAMLGGTPTITPPMWTTLATGATPATHGITCFWNQDPENLDQMIYNLKSTSCTAERIWDVTAEQGIKTLVFHWPGSSWPPTSDSPNLHVVDGTAPSSVNLSAAMADGGAVVYAGEEVTKMVFMPFVANDCGAGCIIYDIPDIQDQGIDFAKKIANVEGSKKYVKNYIMTHADGESATERVPNNVINSPLTEPEGWSKTPAVGAKQFYFYVSNGLVRRPALFLPNEDGVYDHVEVYNSKKDESPLFDLHVGEQKEVIEELKILMEAALNIDCDTVWSPKELYREVIDNCGYIPTPGMSNGLNAELLLKLTIPGWKRYMDWQVRAMRYLIHKYDYRLVLSHVHNVDTMGHNFWHMGVQREDFPEVDSEGILKCMEQTYIDTDAYLGAFMDLIEEGWTILITSDHGLLTSLEEEPPLLGDPFGVNVRVMQEIGYTVLQNDENGNEIPEIDWEKTKAVATRGNYINMNVKGRNPHGIIDPADQYEEERKLIDALYNYRDPRTGKRVVSLALRNKEAVVLGMNGDKTGDIIYMLEEGFNRVHGDSLSTVYGEDDTSVSPIFIACGPGIKENFTTSRVIREIDVCPTIATLMGVRMPEQCEGAPVYQILK